MSIQKTIRFPDELAKNIEEERKTIYEKMKLRPSFNEMLIRIVDSYYNGNKNVSKSTEDTIPETPKESVPSSKQENVSNNPGHTIEVPKTTKLSYGDVGFDDD